MLVALGHALLDLEYEVAAATQLQALGMRADDTVLADADTQARRAHALGAAAHSASGGSIANTLATAAVLGVPSRMLCLLGDDPAATAYVRALRDLGVEIDASRRNTRLPTGTCLVVRSQGEEDGPHRAMSTYLGASAGFSEADIGTQHLRQCTWLLVEGYMLSEDTGWHAVLKAVALARAQKAKVALTLASMFIVTTYRQRYFHLISVLKCDLLIGNEEEFSALFCCEEGEAWAQAPLTIVTRGPAGAMAMLRAQGAPLARLEDAAPRATPVDVLGAGDAFFGGFLAGYLLSGTDTESARVGDGMQLALKLGRIAVECEGARPDARLVRQLAPVK